MPEKSAEEIELTEKNWKIFNEQIYPLIEKGDNQLAKTKTESLFNAGEIAGLLEMSEFTLANAKPKTAELIPLFCVTTVIVFIQWLFPNFTSRTLGLPAWFFWATVPLPALFLLGLLLPLIFRKRNERFQIENDFLKNFC